MNDVDVSDSLVLIVDDSPDTLGMLNDALDDAKMSTLVALEGRQAINIAEKMTPDIILLDALMPGLDGFDTCLEIKSNPRLKNIPVIFMTGLSDTDSIVKGFAAGGIDYLTKPIKPLELIARIKVHLFNSRATISAQSALDFTGQSIFAINSEGEPLWETPAVNNLLDELDKQGFYEPLKVELKQWISHNPTQNNQNHFQTPQKNYTLVYVGTSHVKEHFIRLIDDAAQNEVLILKNEFSITPRESDVFLWLAKGKTNREIAQILEMQPRTVNKHLEQLFRKLEVDNRTSAAALAIQCLQKAHLV